MTNFDNDRVNITITFTEYVAKLILQIIPGNAITNTRKFQTFPSGILFVCPKFSLNLTQLARLLIIYVFIGNKSRLQFSKLIPFFVDVS